jgi:ornithine carbamoyltransferase/carbamoyltransferase
VPQGPHEIGRDTVHRKNGSFLSIRELSPDELAYLAIRAGEIWADPGSVSKSLAGTVVATLFEKTSTRTRTAFSVAALRLGAELINYGPDSLQLNTGESLQDTARILGLMLDGLVIRTSRTLADLVDMVDAGGPPLINAMAAEEHPTQAVCDLATLRRHFGTVANLSVLYVGEGNNTASALAFALARTPGARLTLYVPPGYGLPDNQLRSAIADATAVGATIRQIDRAANLPTEVDAVYTTRWQTTGTNKTDPYWRQTFRPYHVDLAFLARWPDAVFMHDLPAHRGDEVSGEALEAPVSLVWDQARMKLISAIAVLERLWGRQ